jgi:hypothetical protein
MVMRLTRKKPYQFVSRDHRVSIRAGEDFVAGYLYYGSKMQDVLRALGLAAAPVGPSVYVEDEEEQRTLDCTAVVIR